MANEFKHKDPGSELTQAEFISSDGTGHVFDSQASGDILYASSSTVLSRLAKGTDGDILNLASGLPAWTALTNLITLGTHTTGNYVATIANATNGGTTIANSGSETAAVTITVNLNGVAAGTVAVANDSIAIIDADDNSSKKESIADLATAMAGTGITATNGVFSVTTGSSGPTPAASSAENIIAFQVFT